jgi:hypothetical protein
LAIAVVIAAALVGGVLLRYPTLHRRASGSELVARRLVLPFLQTSWGDPDGLYRLKLAICFLLWMVVFYLVTPLMARAFHTVQRTWKDPSLEGKSLHGLAAMAALSLGFIVLRVAGQYVANGGVRPHDYWAGGPEHANFFVFNGSSHAVHTRIWLDGEPVWEVVVPARKRLHPNFIDVPDSKRGPDPYRETVKPIDPKARRLVVEETEYLQERRAFTLSRFTRENGRTFVIRLTPRAIKFEFASVVSD